MAAKSIRLSARYVGFPTGVGRDPAELVAQVTPATRQLTRYPPPNL